MTFWLVLAVTLLGVNLVRAIRNGILLAAGLVGLLVIAGFTDILGLA